MIIIAGYTITEAAKREACVRALIQTVGQARLQDGCLDLSISADSVDIERINIFELWRDQESLDAWRTVAHPPDFARRETCVKRYYADRAEASV